MPTPIAIRRIGLIASGSLLLAALLAGTIALVSVHDPRDMVRLRNSLLFAVADSSEREWRPEQVPEDFLWEKQPAPETFRAVAQSVIESLPKDHTDFDVALGLARHLAQNQAHHGQAIQESSLESYRRIVEVGEGYCSDFSQVFNGLALAAGLPVREWGMSFNTYGGDGHAFNEVFDRKRGKWLFLDTFNSFYFTAGGEPLSAYEIDLALSRGEPALDVEPIDADAFGFRSKQRAIDYYRRGQGAFFLWWGNNVFSYDTSLASRIAGPWSRSGEQLLSIAIGVHPKLRIFNDRVDAAGLTQLRKMKVLLCAAIAFGLAAVVVLCGTLLWARRARRGLSGLH